MLLNCRREQSFPARPASSAYMYQDASCVSFRCPHLCFEHPLAAKHETACCSSVTLMTSLVSEEQQILGELDSLRQHNSQWGVNYIIWLQWSSALIGHPHKMWLISPLGIRVKELCGHFSILRVHHLQEELLGSGVLPERWQWRQRVSME